MYAISAQREHPRNVVVLKKIIERSVDLKLLELLARGSRSTLSRPPGSYRPWRYGGDIVSTYPNDPIGNSAEDKTKEMMSCGSIVRSRGQNDVWVLLIVLGYRKTAT